MCGIAGYLTNSSNPAFRGLEVAAAMSNAIVHRGPDSEGQWCDQSAGIGLAMRRLAIVDKSPAGNQPMSSACGRYVLVFNGEIYNHRGLRAELEESAHAPKWRGHSDTEVLLAAIAAWGLAPTLRKSNGMFGLALWDRKTRVLQLAIDRFGEKPLYCGWQGGTFLFGSELKALRAHPAWRDDLNRDAISLYFRHAYVPAPHTVFVGIAKLEPGEIVAVRADTAPAVDRSAYWCSREAAAAARATPLAVDSGEALEQFEKLFDSAIALRMQADVPLGAFLSGGFDSTAVVASMQRQSSRAVKTFTVGFSERTYDEAPFARAVAAHLGTEHTELYVTSAQAFEMIPRLPEVYDEPFADSSQIPMLLVSQLARRHVTVALSGDGGDELFGGYRRYFISDRLLPALGRLPRKVRAAVAALIRGIGTARADALYGAAFRLGGHPAPGERAEKIAAVLDARSPIDAYRQIVSAWPEPLRLVRRASEPATALSDEARQLAGVGLVEQMMFLDLVSYLPGDILTKLDRATMAVSLEGRVPFLDHRLMEFAWRLPLVEKVSGGEGKRLVRRFVHRHVPRHLMDRPKAGFGVPIGAWLRGPLREWAESLLGDLGTTCGDLIDTQAIDEAWAAHLDGRQNNDMKLWVVLMLQAWHKHWSQMPKNVAQPSIPSPNVA